QTLLGGVDVSRFKLGGETYDVIVRLERDQRSQPGASSRPSGPGREGQLGPLASVVRARESVTPRGVPHFDRLRSATISASLAQGAPLGAALEQMRAIADEVLPDGGGYRVTFSGESEDYVSSGNALAFAYALAVVIVFLTLAGQFDSFFHPITIMVGVMLSFTGALVALELTGNSLNLFSQIGLVMLVGLVTKNSILIVEFANQLRAEGRSLVQATLEASHARLRP